MTFRAVDLGMIPAHLARINYAGDLGYELWVAPEYQRALFDRIVAAGEPHGLRLFGMRALMSLRLEKSYGTWFREYRPIYTPAEGRHHALHQARPRVHRPGGARGRAGGGGPKRRLVAFVVEPDPDDPADVIGDEPIWHDGEVVGWVTSGGYGHHVRQSIALGYVPTELATPDGPGGDGFEIEIIGRRRPARLQPEPLFDPAGHPDAPVTDRARSAVGRRRADRRRRPAGRRSSAGDSVAVAILRTGAPGRGRDAVPRRRLRELPRPGRWHRLRPDVPARGPAGSPVVVASAAASRLCRDPASAAARPDHAPAVGPTSRSCGREVDVAVIGGGRQAPRGRDAAERAGRTSWSSTPRTATRSSASTPGRRSSSARRRDAPRPRRRDRRRDRRGRDPPRRPGQRAGRHRHRRAAERLHAAGVDLGGRGVGPPPCGVHPGRRPARPFEGDDGRGSGPSSTADDGSASRRRHRATRSSSASGSAPRRARADGRRGAVQRRSAARPSDQPLPAAPRPRASSAPARGRPSPTSRPPGTAASRSSSSSSARAWPGSARARGRLPAPRPVVDRAPGPATSRSRSPRARPPARSPSAEAADTHIDAFRRTPLHDEHLALGARMDRFGSWWRPWHYGDADRRVLGGPRGRVDRRRQHARQAGRVRAGRRRAPRAALSVPRRRHQARPLALRAAAQRARPRHGRRDDPPRVRDPVRPDLHVRWRRQRRDVGPRLDRRHGASASTSWTGRCRSPRSTSRARSPRSCCEAPASPTRPGSSATPTPTSPASRATSCACRSPARPPSSCITRSTGRSSCGAR